MVQQALRVIAIVYMLSLGFLPASGQAAVSGIQPRITNISVGVSGGIASYYICVLAPLPPAAGAVTVQGPRQSQQASFQPLNQSCGMDSTLMQATFSRLPAGRYQFAAACVILQPDRAGNAGPPVPCLVRNVGFTSNFQGLTIGSTCQVDFDTRHDMAPQSCSAPGAAGTFAAVGGLSTPAAIATPVPVQRARSVQPAPRSASSSGVAWNLPSANHAFFAEGYTGGGYHEYISLLNPHAAREQVTVMLYRADGATRSIEVPVAGFTRRTLDLNVLAPNASVAARVQATGPLVAERALYLPDGSGHIVAGAGLPAHHWYVAEGYVGSGFADGLRIFNPYDPTAQITITAYGTDGRTLVSKLIVHGGTRQNLALNDIAPAGASALVVDSSEAVVVESVVQRLNGGATSAAMALSAPSRSWYFPDGSTRQGNQEYISLFNPGTATATVHLSAITANGNAGVITVRVGPHTRGSVATQQHVQQGNLALVIQANRPVVAQEVRYAPSGGVSLTNGVSRLATGWALAEGYAGGQFIESIALLNTGVRPATAIVRLIGSHGYFTMLTLMLQPRQTSILPLNGIVSRGSVAAVIQADHPIVVGRTLTFDNGKGLSTTSGVVIAGR